jgi:hypothetical protein
MGMGASTNGVYDPEWITELAHFLTKRHKGEKIKEYRDVIRELYLEYLTEGLRPQEALKKATSVIECFIPNHKSFSGKVEKKEKRQI